MLLEVVEPLKSGIQFEVLVFGLGRVCQEEFDEEQDLGVNKSALWVNLDPLVCS